MEKSFLCIGLILFYLGVGGNLVEAQILKGLGKKLERKVEQRVENKADRQIDKALDKVDQKADESINDALSKKKYENSDKKQRVSKLEPMTARPEEAVLLMGSSCEDFSWFRKGAVLGYESINNKGKMDTEMQMTVRNLTTKGSATIAEVETSIMMDGIKDYVYAMNYICDGEMMYMDMASMMQAMMENNPEMKSEAAQNVIKNTEIDFSNGFAAFPKKMYPGLLLEDLSFSFKTNTGAAEMSFNTLVTDRQVLAREKVTTKAGTFDCLKIRSNTLTSLKIMGMNKKMPESTEYMWIAPKVGMVKQEVWVGDKKTSMELKTYK